MYNLITEILEKSKETGKDIGVAYELLKTEQGSNEDLKAASDFLNENQVEILKLRAKGKEDEIKKLCEVADDKEAVKRQIKLLYNNGTIKE